MNAHKFQDTLGEQRVGVRENSPQNTSVPSSPPTSIVNAVIADCLTYVPRSELLDLVKAIEHCEEAKMEGILVEAGCTAGGSAIVMTAAKSRSRKLVVFDTFGMIPPPSQNDGADVHRRYTTIKTGNSVSVKPSTMVRQLDFAKFKYRRSSPS